MTRTIERPRTAPATKPSGRWRNVFHSEMGWMAGTICPVCGGISEGHWRGDDGKVAYRCDVWPTKEIAEQKAEIEMAMLAPEYRTVVTYLGAEPVP